MPARIDEIGTKPGTEPAELKNKYETSLQLKWEDAIFGGLVKFRQSDRIKH